MRASNDRNQSVLSQGSRGQDAGVSEHSVRVCAVDEIEGSRKLMRLTVTIGERDITIVAGIDSIGAAA